MIDLAPLVNPQSIAVIGASPTSFVGRVALENLRAFNYAGRVYPVNPKYDEVLGMKCYPTVLDIDEPIDAAIIGLSPQASVRALKDAAAAGVRAAVVPATAFAAMGEEGRALQDEMAAVARQHDLALLGPNCMGVLSLVHRAGLYVGTLSAALRRGPIGGILQSGSVCEALANHGSRLGFSYLFSSGNEIVVSKEDLIEFLLADDNTRVIVCFIEGLREPDRFVALAERALAIGKPIVAMKVGRSQAAQQLNVGHTGAMAASDRVFDAVCRQKGILRVHSIDEMMETAALLAGGRLPAGDGVGAITYSGGEASTLLDMAEELGVAMPPLAPVIRDRLREALPDFLNPANPLDPWGQAALHEFIPACLKALGDDPGLHTVFLSIDLPAFHGEHEHEAALMMAREALTLAERVDKPILMSSNISGPLDDGVLELLLDRVPVLQGTRESMLAVRHMIRYAEMRRRASAIQQWSVTVSEATPATVLDQLASSGDKVLDELTSKRILAAFGIPVTDDRLATSGEEAVAHAEGLGFPVALKVAGAIPHKTEAGGVLLNLSSAATVREGYHSILTGVRARFPEAEVKGVLVSPMISGGFEAIAGVTFDAHFGPMVAFGLGGIYAEVLDEVALRRAPLSEADAEEMIAEIRGHKLLAGTRGRLPADLAAARDVLLRLSQIALALREHIREIDINPLFLRPSGAVAADALIVRR